MSNAFRELLRKVGSGVHTHKDLTRAEAEAATRMMLLQEATPAQIGAFMIAHRIKRPTGEELAGMLDAYDQLGPKLQPISSDRPTLILGSPYDGRDRTAPISPITALILAAAGCPVLLHGGDRMPTKAGVPLVELWEGLGLNWRLRSLEEIQRLFQRTLLGFVYLPLHFPLAQGLVSYRDQIGKRPPFATIELLWAPYAGASHVVSGFVHPPTEATLQESFRFRGTPAQFTTVKGLEGSCDLPRDRTSIIGLGQLSDPEQPLLDRLLLHPRDYDLAGVDVAFTSTAQWVMDVQSLLQGRPSELQRSVLWNGGFYLWRAGVCEDMAAGLHRAETMLATGEVAQKLEEIRAAVTPQTEALLKN
ncbi:hypothetical protein BST81_08790 [Leptolyngbya sp. 'hensonii']|uniref:anthranilate phosphoribosyltransferase family protein n=1 Tax=Leptolyngbya sp. 'hensonii' TaxID=1922337 RepID=UPI00094FC15C|nr:anthranilate phosphoribosyltransferase family protein [Leptolyngbya sp. 'hensonii']OLP18822.1 hypothetical protein BST81_08790 [Leptolyngbya sp. 'hensonii']